MPTADRPLRDVLREVLSSAHTTSPCFRVAKELRALAPLLRRLVSLSHATTLADAHVVACATETADELEARP